MRTEYFNGLLETRETELETQRPTVQYQRKGKIIIPKLN
jgi:hypothetical protein